MPSFPTDLLSTADTEKKSFHIKKIRKDSQTGKDIERGYGSLNPFGQFPNEKNSLIFPTVLFFPDNRQPVAYRQQHLLHTRVASHMIVEAPDALCLLVVIVGRIGHVTIPKSIIGQQDTTLIDQWQKCLVSFHIRAFVTVDKRHIKHNAKFWSL